MGTSLILAKILGSYLVIVSIAMLSNPLKMRTMVNDILASPACLALGAFFALTIGLIIINTHNVWVFSWPVIITIIGWIAFIKGLVFLFTVSLYSNMAKWLDNNVFYLSVAVIDLILGVYLCYQGFFVNV
jgi:hypothetical protein